MIDDNILTRMGIQDSTLDLKLQKQCKGCLKIKPLTEYHNKSQNILQGNRDGKNEWCKECRKPGGIADSRAAATLMRKLNLVRPPLGSPCENCGKTDSILVLDHLHGTDIVRGWICRECNTGIAKLGDDIAGVERSLLYLKRSKKSNDV